jgi:hypothetical protein
MYFRHEKSPEDLSSHFDFVCFGWLRRIFVVGVSSLTLSFSLSSLGPSFSFASSFALAFALALALSAALASAVVRVVLTMLFASAIDFWGG